MRSSITGTHSKIARKYHANMQRVSSGGGGGCAKCREKGAPLPARVRNLLG
jgi:hypothetical protein